MDDASYLKMKIALIPNPNNLKKEDLLETRRNYAIFCVPNINAVEAKFKLREQIASIIDVDILQASRKKRHQILFTSPPYSGLQLIQLVWAYIKRNVGRQYSKVTAIKLVKEILDSEFLRLTTVEDTSIISGIIKHMDKKISMFVEEIRREDELESPITVMSDEEPEMNCSSDYSENEKDC